MNEKEVSEIRRRLRLQKNSISHIHGCYVNEKREVVSQFSQSLGLMPEAEAEKILALLKKTLSGTLSKNLMDIEFTTQQVVEGAEHALLMELRDSALKNESAVQAFLERVAQSVTLESSYMVLLAQDTYDVPYRAADGQQQDDASTDVFSYMLCSICPVKQTKPALSYYVYENEFHSLAADLVISPPELGFMFPAFDDRTANIYKAMYYNRDTAENYADFAEAIFSCEAPVPAAEQKESFRNVLGESLAEESSYEVVQAIHGELGEMIEVHKLNKTEEPLVITKSTVRRMLSENGVADEHIKEFDERYDDEFGAETSISPRNLVDTKQIEITTADATIRVNGMRGDLINTRVIDGSRYILIKVEDEAQVNGVPINIT